MRTLAAILVFALPTGWAAFAATNSGTDHKTAPKTTAKKTTGTKAPAGAPAGKTSTSTGKASTSNASTSKMSINKTSSTGKTTPNSKTIASTSKPTSSKTGGTASSIKTASSKTGASKTSTKQQASTRYHRTPLIPSTDRYKEIQQALADKGYFGGTADGSWGSTSVDALKRFQHDQSLIEDGKIGSLSLIALGLGPKRGGTSFLAAPAHEAEPVTGSDSRADQPAFQPPADQPLPDQQ